MRRFYQYVWMAVAAMTALLGGSAFAAEGGAEHAEHAAHGLPKIAPHLFTLSLPGGIELPFSNSMVMLVLAILLIGLIVWLATRAMRMLPGKLQNGVEYFFETLYKFVENLIGPDLTRKHFWYFGTVFTLILVSNYMGLLPGVGIITYDGEVLFRGANADMNVTMFLGLSYAILWLIWSIKEQGFKGFFMHLFGPKGDTPGFMGTVLIPVFLFVGVIECLSIAIRPIALAARLFGNIYGGETVIEMMSVMTGNVILNALCVLPFLCLELLVGFIQALVFLLLTAIFLKLQVGDGHGHGKDEHAAVEEKEPSKPA